jgi:hypothetical protein
MTAKFPFNTFLAAATFAGILLEFHYAVDPARGMDLRQLRPAVEFRHDREAFLPVRALPLPPVPESLAVPDPTAPGWSPAVAANLTLETADLFDQAGAMDHFYAALAGLVEGKRSRPVRIVHYGDSPTTADLITGDARELLQDRFGNAGPGFVLIAKPWAWYGHHGVEVDGSGWSIATAVGSMREGEYGLGGASFTGQPGASSTIRLTARDLASIEIEYLERPGAGSIEVLADGASVGTVSQRSAIRCPDGCPAGGDEAGDAACGRRRGGGLRGGSGDGQERRHLRQHRAQRRLDDSDVPGFPAGELVAGARAPRSRPGGDQLRHQRERLPEVHRRPV